MDFADLSKSPKIKVSNILYVFPIFRISKKYMMFHLLFTNKMKKSLQRLQFKSGNMITPGVLRVEIGARSLVEVLPVVKVKSDKDNLYW